MVVTPSHRNDRSAGGCARRGGGRKRGGVWRRRDHPVMGRAGVSVCSALLTSPSPPTTRRAPAAHLRGEGAQRACHQQAALKTLQQAQGFHALLQHHDSAKAPHCSRDRAEAGRCQEAGPAQGDLWDRGWGLKRPEKDRGVGQGARHAPALSGEVGCQGEAAGGRWGSRRWAGPCDFIHWTSSTK